MDTTALLVIFVVIGAVLGASRRLPETRSDDPFARQDEALLRLILSRYLCNRETAERILASYNAWLMTAVFGVVTLNPDGSVKFLQDDLSMLDQCALELGCVPVDAGRLDGQ